MRVKKATHMSFLSGLGGVLISFYMQYGLGFMPCVLCELQRYLLMALSVLAGLLCLRSAGVWKRCCKGVYAALWTLGFALALRHVWLLHFTHHSTTACLPDLITLWHLSSLQHWLEHIISPSSCGHMATVWGLGLPDAVVLWYAWMGWLLYHMRSRGA